MVFNKKRRKHGYIILEKGYEVDNFENEDNNNFNEIIQKKFHCLKKRKINDLNSVMYLKKLPIWTDRFENLKRTRNAIYEKFEKNNFQSANEFISLRILRNIAEANPKDSRELTSLKLLPFNVLIYGTKIIQGMNGKEIVSIDDEYKKVFGNGDEKVLKKIKKNEN